MTKPNLHWRNAQLPPKTVVFAIGDIHAHNDLLRPLLIAIESKIASLPPGVKAHVIFIGDYIDRGPDGPATLALVMDFERRMANKANVAVHLLCGNHDEYFKRLLETPAMTDRVLGEAKNPADYRHCVSDSDASMTIKGLEAWLFIGGGVTTVRDYVPGADFSLFDGDGRRFNREHPRFSIGAVNELVKALAAAVPPAHKNFFARIYANNHVILGDYLFVHAGVDPEKTLAAQGIGPGAFPLRGKAYFDFLMMRDPFLWHGDEALPYCPYVVVHGHTPSELASVSGTLADGRKRYRLCIDTKAYAPHGSLTCFVRQGDDAGFMAVHRANPDTVEEYHLPAE